MTEPKAPKTSQGFKVIQRYAGQRIKIGDHIEIFLSSVGRGKARLAVRAPGEIIHQPNKEEDQADREAWLRRQYE